MKSCLAIRIQRNVWVVSISGALLCVGCSNKTSNQRSAGISSAPVAAMPGAAVTSSPASASVKIPSAAVLVTNKGKIRITFYSDTAPKAVLNFVDLAIGTKTWTDPGTGQPVQKPFFDGTIFHRVIPDVLIQAGMPVVVSSAAIATGPGYRFDDEISPAHPFDKAGLVATASPEPNANGSQFFITLAPAPWLNNKHTVFGEISSGLDVAKAISEAPRDSDDKPLEPVVIKEIRIEYQ